MLLKPTNVYKDQGSSLITYNSASFPRQVHYHLLVVGLIGRAGGADTDGQETHVIFGRGEQMSQPGGQLSSQTFTVNSLLNI